MSKKRLGILEIIVEIIILIVFARLMFDIGYLTGIFYLVAIGIVAYKRILFRKRNISWMIIGGTFLSYFAGLFIPYIVGNYRAGNIVSAIIILLVFILIWRKARRLKIGKK